MDANDLKHLLTALQAGDLSIEEGLDRLKELPFEDVGIAKIDHHRALRQGVPEVVLGEAKTTKQLEIIVQRMAAHGDNVLVTRVSGEKAKALLKNHPGSEYDADARTFVLQQKPHEDLGRGKILIICAGTSDLPVAKEAAITARMFNNQVEELVDVGVAGIHRLLAHTNALREASVIIVVAGMEGALPSVVGGLVDVAVIKTVDNATPLVNDTIAYAISVSNNGPAGGPPGDGGGWAARSCGIHDSPRRSASLAA